MYSELTSDHPADLCCCQVLNYYSGRISMIILNGESKGENNCTEAIDTAGINKRSGEAGMIMGRKALQQPFG